MKVDPVEYRLARIVGKSGAMQAVIGDLETAIFRKQLDNLDIVAPIFITGLARSGTTILLNYLNRAKKVDGHRYSDYPLIYCPIFWSMAQKLLGGDQAMNATERAHKDGILIDRNSRDAFEEPLWRHFFALERHDSIYGRKLGANDKSTEFDTFFSTHIKKILYLRGCTRYLSKGNYNFLRLGYLQNLFPDAQFVIVVRHPLNHVQSLVRQHEIFKGYARKDSRVAHYLALLGHYEFGPNRCAPGLDSAFITGALDQWKSGRDFAGYALVWAGVYEWLLDVRDACGVNSGQLHFIRYEDFCREPANTLLQLGDKLNLDFDSRDTAQAQINIKESTIPVSNEHLREFSAVKVDVARVSRRLDYNLD